MDFIENSNSKINIAYGGKRAGKNFCINIRLIKYLTTEPISNPLSLFGFFGESKGSVERNFFQDLFQLIGESNYLYNAQRGNGYIFKRPFQIFDYSNSRSIRKLQGSTLGGAAVTELAYCRQEVFDDLQFRLSVTGSICFIDFNPDFTPFHWINTDFVEGEKAEEKIKKGIIKVWHFTYQDNPSLDNEYIKKLLILYPVGSLGYKRYILGLIVMAEGICFYNFNEERHIRKAKDMPRMSQYEYFIISVDPGTSNAFGALKIGVKTELIEIRKGHYLKASKYYVFQEYYYDSKDKEKPLTEAQYCINLAKFIKDIPNPFIYVDSSRASFKQEIRTNLLINMRNLGVDIAKYRYTLKDPYYYIEGKQTNEVNKSIDIVNQMYAMDLIVISEDCKVLKNQISSYTWDEKKLAVGIEEPIKKFDHLCDAKRYGIVPDYCNKGKIEDIEATEEIDYNGQFDY